MPRPALDQIITANALIEGDVIYFTAADTWSRELQDAEVLSDDAIAQSRLIEAMAQAHVAVGAYLMTVKQIDTHLHPTHFREDFRTKGPSNYFHGKQERYHV